MTRYQRCIHDHPSSDYNHVLTEYVGAHRADIKLSPDQWKAALQELHTGPRCSQCSAYRPCRQYEMWKPCAALHKRHTSCAPLNACRPSSATWLAAPGAHTVSNVRNSESCRFAAAALGTSISTGWILGTVLGTGATRATTMPNISMHAASTRMSQACTGAPYCALANTQIHTVLVPRACLFMH
jgi:hypothetical protein